MKLRLLVPRLALLLPLLLVLVALVMRSSLLRLVGAPGVLVLGYVAGGLALALLPSLLASASPLPGTMAVIVPVLALASYDQSRLDWLRLLKDYEVAEPGAPSLVRLALALAALLLAWALHIMDASLRIRWSAEERQIPEGQGRVASRVVRAAGARAAGLALAGTALAGLLALAASRLDAALILGGRASLVAPLAAVALLAASAIALWRGRRGGADKAGTQE